MSAWEVEGLVVRFPGITAVQHVSLTVEVGERVGIVGTSGSGKTTLVRAGLGLVPHHAGTVRVFDEDVARWTESRWCSARQRVQLLFQDPAAMLHPQLSIGLLLCDSAAIHQPSAQADEVARATLALVGLEGRFEARPHELSGGERRRVGVARILISRPELLVVDEPTVGLDAELKASLLALLLAHIPPHCAVVLVSHDLPVVAWATERIAVMDRGTMVDVFPSDQPAKASHPTSRALLEAAGMLPAASGP